MEPTLVESIFLLGITTFFAQRVKRYAFLIAFIF